MNYRNAKILAEEDIGDAGTKTIDINIADIISRITIAFAPTKSKHGMDSYAHKNISKIELVDGSDVLHSLDGGQNQALCIYDRRCPTMKSQEEMTGVKEYSLFGIDFGRFLFDPVLALDPKRFKNLQLKITWDENVSDTGVSVNGLEIWADCFDEKVISPMGFLSAKNYESWTLSAAGVYKYVDLPTDRAIRKMLIQGYLAGKEPWYQVLEARLSEDNDKRIPFDLDLEDYQKVMRGVWAPVEEGLCGVCTSAGGNLFYVTPSEYMPIVNPTYLGDLGYVSENDTWNRGGKFTPRCSGTTAFFMAKVFGYLPNHCFEIPFGDPKDMDDWYDVTKLGSLRLRLKSGSGTSGNVDTILQQLRKY